MHRRHPLAPNPSPPYPGRGEKKDLLSPRCTGAGGMQMTIEPWSTLSRCLQHQRGFTMLRDLKHVLSNGPEGPVFAVAFHPRSALLATGDAKGTVKLWDLATGEVGAILRGHRQAVWSVAFS